MTSLALSPDATRNWLAIARDLVKSHPLTIPGPYGDPIAVGHQGDHSVLIAPMFEREADRQYVPIELEVVPGCVVPLSEVRIYYEDEV
jgi:hypothetical protein